MTDTVTNEPLPSLDPSALLAGEINQAKLDAFRKAVFQTVDSVEELRDWLSTPMAKGVARGVALWALGRHAESVALLEPERSNPAVALCLADNHAALGHIDQVDSILAKRSTDAAQALSWLRALDSIGDGERLAADLAKLGTHLGETDRKYFDGRVRELRRDSEGAIACYDDVLALDPNHRYALFRLAVNVDLRGEDEEARELYERALMLPPVNAACVVNLGILYEDIGNYRRAMQCFDLALQANPENARARLFRRDAAAALNMYYDEDQERRDDKRNKLLRTPINDFELSVRSRNCLAKMNIKSLGDLVKKTEAELLSYKNFGETSLNEIKDILKIKGLRLGMTADELMSKDLGEASEPVVHTEEAPDPESPDPIRRPITELDLSVRSRRIVDLLKIRTIGDLSSKTEAELLACPNFGQTSLNEIKTKLDELGLSLRG
ncbi:MAG: tetratricopeptide repeat protein [Planctomycetes bacterium]|nr:tetratricopeptide repeat protein [Planctomycetota bacterium]